MDQPRPEPNWPQLITLAVIVLAGIAIGAGLVWLGR